MLETAKTTVGTQKRSGSCALRVISSSGERAKQNGRRLALLLNPLRLIKLGLEARLIAKSGYFNQAY